MGVCLLYVILCLLKFCNYLDERGRERERERELVDFLKLSSRCLLIVVWLFLAVPRVCLQFEIVVFPDHTHL